MLTLKTVQCEVAGKRLLNLDALELKAGEFLALLGPNGAGKSTLLKSISGDMPATGKISFYGRALGEWPSLARARHLGVLPQASQLSFPFTAREVVALGLTPLSLSRKQADITVRDKMELTDCWSFADRAYPTLSGGERQRVQLARVLLQLSQAEHSPLLLLDEPTSAQDLGQQHAILALAKSLAHDHGFGVIAVLHDLNQVLQYCDRACVLTDGQLHQQGNPEQILTQDMIHDYWHYRPERVHLADGRIAVI
ncbi:heme ABC transporter ATP-binding protein [Corallincola platygyrae]|uniref:Heme ABC transporter ATP-binding protein n=1 Tax=Corallincola platygyrae TaxID=1193278 RepID=A0ABW4XHX7_9GAMM